MNRTLLIGAALTVAACRETHSLSMPADIDYYAVLETNVPASTIELRLVSSSGLISTDVPLQISPREDSEYMVIGYRSDQLAPYCPPADEDLARFEVFLTDGQFPLPDPDWRITLDGDGITELPNWELTRKPATSWLGTKRCGDLPDAGSEDI